MTTVGTDSTSWTDMHGGKTDIHRKYIIINFYNKKRKGKFWEIQYPTSPESSLKLL